MSLVSKWCSFSNLTTHMNYKAKHLNNKKHTKTCIKARLGSDGDDFRAWKRIIRLNSAFQNRSAKELFELACDECKFFFSSLPTFNPFSLSKGAFDLLHALMLYNNVTFLIKPTAKDGFDFGIRWTIESKDHNLPLALGCNIHTYHEYKGHLILRKANHIIEPLMHINSLPQKVQEILVPLVDKIVPKDILDGKRRDAFIYILVSLVVMLIYYALMQKLV